MIKKNASKKTKNHEVLDRTIFENGTQVTVFKSEDIPNEGDNLSPDPVTGEADLSWFKIEGLELQMKKGNWYLSALLVQNFAKLYMSYSMRWTADFAGVDEMIQKLETERADYRDSLLGDIDEETMSRYDRRITAALLERQQFADSCRDLAFDVMVEKFSRTPDGTKVTFIIPHTIISDLNEFRGDEDKFKIALSSNVSC